MADSGLKLKDINIGIAWQKDILLIFGPELYAAIKRYDEIYCGRY